MLQSLNILEAVRERDVDLLLIEELYVNAQFNHWLADSVIKTDATFLGAWHSVTGNLGESDIVVLYQAENRSKTALLIENKIDACPQPDQALRYHQRGEEGIDSGNWDQFFTCLVAPEAYLKSDNEEYQNEISYESVMQFFLQQETDRANYRASIIHSAIEQHRRGFQRTVDQRVTEFGADYITYVKQNYPYLNIRSYDKERSRGHDWFYFHPYNDSDITLEHQAGHGRVLIRLSGEKYVTLQQSIAEFVDNASISGLLFRPAKRSISIAIDVPVVQASLYSFDDCLPDISKAFEHLTELYQLGNDPFWETI